MNITSLAICTGVLLLFVFGKLFPVAGAEMFCVFILVDFCLPFSKMGYKAFGTLDIRMFVYLISFLVSLKDYQVVSQPAAVVILNFPSWFQEAAFDCNSSKSTSAPNVTVWVKEWFKECGFYVENQFQTKSFSYETLMKENRQIIAIFLGRA